MPLGKSAKGGATDLLLAAIDADPTPLVEMAISRLQAIEGQPTQCTPNEVRFRHGRSLWINRRTGTWRDWRDGVGGGSWRLATVLAGIDMEEIRDLYGFGAEQAPLPQTMDRLRAAAAARQQRLAEEEAKRREQRRRLAARLLAEAVPSVAGDPASRYLRARGLSDLSGIWFHDGPVIRTADDQERRLAPSVLYALTDGTGALCAVHCVQLNPATNQRLQHPWARLSIGNLVEGYARFGPKGPIICLGEGVETVASVAMVVPRWRCLASCSGIRLVPDDPDIAQARRGLLLAERGAEDVTRARGLALAAAYPSLSVYLAHVPDNVPGDKADMNDALKCSAAYVRHALSVHQLECLYHAL